MSSLKIVWEYMFSPKLIQIYGNGPVEKFYQPSTLEKWSDQVISSLYFMWKLGVYSSPFLVGILYQRGYLEPDGLITLTKLVTSVGVILVVSFCFRGLSRAQNPTYRNFFTTLKEAETNMTPIVKQQLNMYNFDFTAWPVEYRLESNSVSTQRRSIRKSTSHQSLIQYIINIPYKIIAYVAIHTFGIRLIYPGTIGLFQKILEQSILQGRSRLIELYRGERFKIQTADNNEIDTMFVNRRSASPTGNTLVICCEGNAGFYEIGIAITPIEAGYSVLGWNHPGFAGSTGKPYPPQEQNAIDAVIQFAINKLGFKLENILLFGWSIGGYSATWAAMNYPEIKGVILDATFDDVLPLAINHMPSWWEPIVKLAIREHVNLNIFEQLSRYPGAVLLIRRTEDEVICLKENDLSSNRGNHLLIKLLRHRYPCIYDDTQIRLLLDYLSVTHGSQDDLVNRYAIDENMCQSLLQSYISECSKSYPMKVGEEFSNHEKAKMAIFLIQRISEHISGCYPISGPSGQFSLSCEALDDEMISGQSQARKYMKDFKATHCINLPSEMFEAPWDVNIESDFVFT